MQSERDAGAERGGKRSKGAGEQATAPGEAEGGKRRVGPQLTGGAVDDEGGAASGG